MNQSPKLSEITFFLFQFSNSDLKRFSETRWSKMTNIVEFPTGERELNMAPYAANSSSAQYSLYGICNHMGKNFNRIELRVKDILGFPSNKLNFSRCI